MTEAAFALDDLNDAIARGTAESRAKALWHATDILVAGEFGEDDIRLFGEVIARLADEIEETARAELSERLARSDNAPPKVVRMLAFDDSIRVAAPVLQFSTKLDVKSLIANVRTKSQPHLLAISRRPSVPPSRVRRIRSMAAHRRSPTTAPECSRGFPHPSRPLDIIPWRSSARRSRLHS